MQEVRKRVFHNPVIGDQATLLRTADGTNGEYTLLEVIVAPGGGNTLHIHESFSERFEVVEGQLSVTLNNKESKLAEGESAFVPARAVHCFNNKTSKPVKFLVEFRPAQPGFEKALAIGYGLAADGLVNKDSIPKNILHLAVLANMGGTVPIGFIRVMMPLFKLIGRMSKKTETELVNKYCYA